jgi:hypothetical protein
VLHLIHEATDEIARGHGEEARTLYNRALAALGPGAPAKEELIGQIREALGNSKAHPQNNVNGPYRKQFLAKAYC